LWCGANVDAKKKSDEEAKKKQRIWNNAKEVLCSQKRGLKSCGGGMIQEQVV
jgi:hypothetical protein